MVFASTLDAGAGAKALIASLATDSSISGSRLAERFGVTRAAVWKQVEQLRALGLPVIADIGRGYRLQAPVDLLDSRRIECELMRHAAQTAHMPSLGDIAVHWRLDSTNSELLRRAAHDPRDRLACLAEIQSAGRGRRGRDWHLPLGGGLALSLLKRFEGSMSSLAGLSLAAGLAIVRGLDDCGVESIALKWPNDVVANGRKLAGILVELGGEALGPCHAVIGIGINVRLDRKRGTSVDQPWTDLATLARCAPPERNQLALAILKHLLVALDTFAIEGFSAFRADYAKRDTLAGKPVRASWSGGTREGIAIGVDARGALRVRDAGGEFRVDGGEVSVRPIE